MGLFKKSKGRPDTTAPALNAQSTEMNNLWRQWLDQASEKDPLTEALREENLGFLEDIKKPNFDVTTARGMQPYVSLWRRAKEGQEGDRMGTGLLQMGAQGSSPDLVARLNSQRASEREQNAAGGLEEAFQRKNAMVRGEAMDLGQMEMAKRMGILGNVTGRAEGASNRWLQWMVRPKQPNIWERLLQGGLGAAGAYLTGGLSGGGGGGGGGGDTGGFQGAFA